MNTLKKTAFSALAVCWVTGMVHATPSTTYWTPATTDIQPYRTLHVGIDNYFTVFKKGDSKGSFPTDAGLTVGVLPFEKVQAEVGVDLMEPTDDPWYLNAKIGTPEGAMFKGSPALNVGVFNVGTRKDVTNQDVFFVLAGKTIPVLGRLFGGYYIGNDKVLVNGDGDPDNKGFMVGFDHGFLPVKDKSGDEYSRVVLAGDWASGKNAIGGGGVGVYYYFTKNIALLTGPVFFNDEVINGQWKWTTQLDINIPF